MTASSVCVFLCECVCVCVCVTVCVHTAGLLLCIILRFVEYSERIIIRRVSALFINELIRFHMGGADADVETLMPIN